MHPPPIMTTSAVAFMMRPQFTLWLCAYGRGATDRAARVFSFLRMRISLVDLRFQISNLRFLQISDFKLQSSDFRLQSSDLRLSQIHTSDFRSRPSVSNTRPS